MLNPEAMAVVEQATSNRNLTFIVSIRADDEIESVRRISNPAQRISALKTLLQRVKKPLLSDLSKYRDDGVRIINRLDGTPQLIVAGPADTWRKLIADRATPLFDPNIEFLSNEPIWTVEPASG